MAPKLGFKFFKFDREGDGTVFHKELGNIMQCIDPDCQAWALDSSGCATL